MKKLFCIFIYLFTLSAAASSDDQKIHLLFNNLSQAMNVQDIDGVVNSWSKNGEMLTLAGGIIKGQDELIKLFFQSFSKYKEAKYQLLIQYVRIDGNRATVDGIWKTSKAGPPTYPSCGIFVYTLSKNNNIWKIDLAASSVPREGHTAEHGRIMSWTKECKNNPL